MSRNNNLSGGLFAAKPTTLTVKETSLSAMIADWLTNRRIYNDRLQCGEFETPSGHWMRGAKRGTPDRFCIIRGQIIFIEVKTATGKISPAQRAKHDELCAHGAIVLICDSFENFIGKMTAIRAALDVMRGANLYE